MNRAEYRKHSKHKCVGCDHPCYAPSKNVNAKMACIKCRKNSTKRVKYNGDYEEDGEE